MMLVAIGILRAGELPEALWALSEVNLTDTRKGKR